ncbi:hypothetical protein U1Q18_006338 [Sarracenia purpurea var. burkii]
MQGIPDPSRPFFLQNWRLLHFARNFSPRFSNFLPRCLFNFLNFPSPFLEDKQLLHRKHVLLSFRSTPIQRVCFDFWNSKTMSATDSSLFDLAATVSHFLNFPESVGKFTFPSRSNETQENKGVSSIPVDILETPKEYVFYMDVPGLSKSDVQVTVEEENTLVIRSNGKRKREDGEEEGCRYIRLERRAPHKLLRKFRLPENSNTQAITAKCENGVLTVAVEKLPPPAKSKKVEVAIA